jgi:hypothetical protein
MSGRPPPYIRASSPYTGATNLVGAVPERPFVISEKETGPARAPFFQFHFALLAARFRTLLRQILPCRMNEMTSEYRVSDSTKASPMIIGTKSWLVLLGLRPIDSIAEAASFP